MNDEDKKMNSSETEHKPDDKLHQEYEWTYPNKG